MAIEVIVVGAGGFGREVLDVVEAHNAAKPAQSIRVRGVVDDAPAATNLERLAMRGYRYLGPIDWAIADGTGDYILGIGRPAVKRAIAARFEAAGWRAASAIHPAAVVGTHVRIGQGVVVCGGAQVSTNVALGRYVHINPNATIGHDAQLRDFVSVNPGAIVSGEVIVDEGTLVGAGAVILQGLSVGTDVVVGASACVTRDVSARSTMVGIPARPLSMGGSASPRRTGEG
jgi:sugar O-acyltransferase (sialic acid O-acetyltransferase NeuD family)